MQILVIDPSSVFTNIIAKEFSNLADSIFMIHNEQESWELFKDFDIDLVISGMQLKGSDGLHFKTKVDTFFRETRKTKMPYFVFVTGDSKDDWENKIVGERIFGIFNRKFESGQFQATLKEKLILATKTRKDQLLVVDDSDLNRQLLKKILRKSKFRILEANDGSDALLKLQESKGEIHIVISDNYMRFMNGIELFEKMRVIKEFKEIPFIMLTGDDDSEQKEEWKHRGLKYLLHKPYSEEDLLLELSKAILFS